MGSFPGGHSPVPAGRPAPRQGAKQDLAEAVARNAQGLYRYLLVRLGGDRELAEELMQELCLQAVRTHRRSASGPVQVDRWLFGVARNILRRHFRWLSRRRRNLPQVDADVAGQLARALDRSPLPPEMLERRETHRQLVLALTALPSEDQELLLRSYFDGQSHTEIAHRLGLSARAVEGRMYRARKALKDKLAHMDRDWFDSTEETPP